MFDALKKLAVLTALLGAFTACAPEDGEFYDDDRAYTMSEKRIPCFNDSDYYACEQVCAADTTTNDGYHQCAGVCNAYPSCDAENESSSSDGPGLGG